MTFANDSVVSFQELYSHLSKKFKGLSKEETVAIVNSLQKEYIMYANENLSQIVTIIDTSLIRIENECQAVLPADDSGRP